MKNIVLHLVEDNKKPELRRQSYENSIIYRWDGPQRRGGNSG